MKQPRIHFVLIFCIFSLYRPFLLRAQDIRSWDVADDSSIRISLLDSWFNAPPQTVLKQKATRFDLLDGSRLEVRTEQGGDEFMIILARERSGAFPLWSQGSWILYRRLSDGQITRIRVFLRSDPYTYIQFRPNGKDRSYLDALVYGGYVARSISIAQSLDRLLILPLNKVIKAVGSQFPDRYYNPHIADYADIRALSLSIRSRLGELSYADDGAYDESGVLVRIASSVPQNQSSVPQSQSSVPLQDAVLGGVNCSGFTKWVVDGMLKPLTGTRLAIPALKVPPVDRGSSFSDPYEALRDPYFGLDWTRNLAFAANAVLRHASKPDVHDWEVTKSPILALRVPRGSPDSSRSYPPYLKDAGFGIEGLKPTLYALSIDEPGRLYLASVSKEMGEAPRLRQHFHVAVFLPFFEEDGTFSIKVFESALETQFDVFVARYPGHHVNLVRIPAESKFEP